MPHSLFISDLHLSADQPRSTELFQHFMQHTAPQAEALYVLGDLFEYWAGDDDIGEPLHQLVTGALQKLAGSGTRIYLMHGNRDLLMGKALAASCGATLLLDPTLVDLYGTPTLLVHGDTLCTDDHDYQSFRSQVHDPEFQRQFLAQPLAQRKDFIAQLRLRSEAEKQTKGSDIMDVNARAVADLLRAHNYPRLIHGHTHRLSHHLHHVDGHTCDRWVLGDWHTTGSALRCSATGCELVKIEI